MSLPGSAAQERGISIERLVLEVPGFTAAAAPTLAEALAERIAGADLAGNCARIEIALASVPASHAALAERIAAALMQRVG